MIPKPHEASIVLYVSDIARSERFYRDALGLEIERREGAEPFWMVANLAAKGVTIVTPVSEAPGGWSADFADPDGFSLGLWQPGDKPRSLAGTRKA